MLNVAFENPRKLQHQVGSEHGIKYAVPDRLSGIEEQAELKRLCPGRQWNFVSSSSVHYGELANNDKVEVDVDFAVSNPFKCNYVLNY